MAHFAELDANNIVTRVVVVNNEDIFDYDTGKESEEKGIAFLTSIFGGIWKQTSYNSNFRKNYAGVGCRYDETLDAFIPPKPFPSWTLNSNCKWESPVPIPADFGKGDPPKLYRWNENNQVWIAVEI